MKKKYIQVYVFDLKKQKFMIDERAHIKSQITNHSDIKSPSNIFLFCHYHELRYTSYS
jgi:hypothetical protein